MKKYLIILLALVPLFITCVKREWANPFDPACPKELWTPTNFTAVQEGSTIKLTWSQPLKNIAGFKLTKKIDTGTATDLMNQSKDAVQYVDAGLTGGKIHSYTITAYAGSNQSNIVTIQVTPTFVSTLSTTTITSVKAYAAALSSTIASDGGAPVTGKGICWSTSPNPTIANTKTNDGSGVGTFTSNLTGLSSSTQYYARTYATNSAGTAYGTQVSFTTFYGEVTDADGNVYQTLKIGNQIWMAENLKTTKYNDGTLIPNVTVNSAWTALTTGAYCFYNNDAATYKATYGALYNWYAVNTNKLAPTGWHVPTDAEWTALTTYLGGASIAGGKLKESGMAHWTSPNTGATNEYRFTAVPGGGCNHIGGFYAIGTYGYWWSSSEYSSTTALYWFMYYIYNSAVMDNTIKQFGLSVRCILGTLTTPIVSTAAISSLTYSSATSGGTITSDGGTNVTNRGVCWSTLHNPTIVNSKTINGTGSGAYTDTIKGLSNNTTYYVRAYATNLIGTSYGSESSFILNMNVPGPNITDIDGNVYKTVTIGTQTWMAENLKVTKYRNGVVIPNVTDGITWASLKSGAWCDFTNNVSFGATYGHLYNFYAVVDSRQLCPTGWHVPSDAEWTILLNFLGGKDIAGGKMKESGNTHWASPNVGATNSSGFTAIGGGSRGGDGPFYYWVNVQYWWSTTPAEPNYSWFYSVQYEDQALSRRMGAYFAYSAGISVRCIKD